LLNEINITFFLRFLGWIRKGGFKFKKEKRKSGSILEIK
jgi:hypothetical protein